MCNASCLKKYLGFVSESGKSWASAYRKYPGVVVSRLNSGVFDHMFFVDDGWQSTCGGGLGIIFFAKFGFVIVVAKHSYWV